jgi:hypothetical protein
MKWQNSVRSATDLQWKRNGATKGGAYICTSPHEERGNGKIEQGIRLPLSGAYHGILLDSLTMQHASYG